MLQVRLLGPVEVWEGNRRAPLGGVRPLAVLSALVVHLGEVLSTERLVDCVWDEQAPATATALVATHVSAVRRALARVGEADVIRTRPPGYVTDLDASQVDARSFEELLTSGRAEAARGRADEASELLSEALGLWRGQEAMEGLGQSFARIEAARLGELRLVAQEESFGLQLELGRADRTIAPLLAHVAAHPLRERPRGQLMTALFRTGRVSDALRTYQEGREVLREELGIDAGPELRALHKAVLTSDPSLLGTGFRPHDPALLGTGSGPHDPAPPGSGARPHDPSPLGSGSGPSAQEAAAASKARQRTTSPTTAVGTGPDAPSPRPAPSHLPPDIADFVGRSDQIDWAVSLLGRVDDPGRTAPPIGVISGRSGTGKTALAVHVGHRTAELFPDGRLFVDLRAADTAPCNRPTPSPGCCGPWAPNRRRCRAPSMN